MGWESLGVRLNGLVDLAAHCTIATHAALLLADPKLFGQGQVFTSEEKPVLGGPVPPTDSLLPTKTKN